MDELEKDSAPEQTSEEELTQADNTGAESTAAEENTPAEQESETPVEETASVELENVSPTEETEQAGPPKIEGTTPEEEQTEPGAGEGAKKTPGKIALAVAFVVVLAAALIALVVSGFRGKKSEEAEPTTVQATVDSTENSETEETVAYTIPADGNPDDVTCKGSYTASDAEVDAARDTVVATAGDKELTLGQLQVYYWMQVREFLSNYGYYLSYFGLDYTQGLDMQLCPAVENQTWQQYFLNQALLCWQSYQSMASEAENHGVKMPESYRTELEQLADNLEKTAESSGFASAEELVHGMLGSAATYEDYKAFLSLYYEGLGYFSQVTDGYTVTDEEIEAYFNENSDTYAEDGITKDSVAVNVRHILIMPEGATSETIRTDTFPDEAWEAGKTRAEEILAMWKKGDMTEESFAELAKEHSEDAGSKENGGLYENVTQGQMVTEFNDWCFDANRQPGDFDIVKTDFGYHIMYFCESRLQWKDYAKEDLLSQMSNEFVQDVADKYPLTVDFEKILLGYVDLGA